MLWLDNCSWRHQVPGKKTLIVATLILLGVAALAWRHWHPQPLAVQVVTVERGDVEATVANTRAGTVKACRRSRLSMPIGGVVDKLLVSEGDQVVAGQLLLELWNHDRAAEVNQARQQLLAVEFERESTCLQADLKAREAQRLQRLAASKLASEEQLDSAATAAQTQGRLCAAASNQAGVASARLDLQQAVFERTRLRAPFAGVVAEINGEIGEYITPSPPGIPTPAAVDLIDYSCLYVTAPIDEVDAAKLQVGLPARIGLDAFREQLLVGKISRIAPYVLDLEKQARTVDVDVRFDQVPAAMTLLVGYSADITVVLERRENVLRLPAEAILADASVWLVNADNQLQRRVITRGIGNWTLSEVRSGLAEGDRVVRNPDRDGLAEGVAVVVGND
ncbi:efflux RND transporter periplasmic adaptor subunit [Pseudomaricurvus alcaniphilus]|nr:efflux RND transporter periplasmic adaptor subunit [Pseudomaricurvus alcaniphilus]NHN36983.1 efflux RND transporter periplasmic adaptor subunit [Pseudomaricurvus alcaniphilus]